MEIFELHFNPKLNEDVIFDSFCYEPENIYEKKLGSLYMAGELKNAFSQNPKFLSNLAQVIKKQYFELHSLSPERSLRASLKKTNNFLFEKVQKDNTSWLGNLNFAILAIRKNSLNLTKVGDIKILLLRGTGTIDIGERAELKEFEPYPLKIFKNIISGKLVEDDLIMVLTKETYDFFVKENLIDEISRMPPERIKKFLKTRNKLFSGISGLCLLISLRPKVLKKETFAFEKKLPVFSLRQFFAKMFNRAKSRVTFKVDTYKKLNKKIILIIALIIVLLLGFFIFKQ